MTRLLQSGRRWWLVAGMLVVGMAAVGASQLGLYATDNTDSQPGGRASLGYLPEEKQKAPEEVTGVETLPVEAIQANQTLPVTGHLTADEQSEVAANTSGIVAEVRVERGSVVAKGDVLVRLDPTDAENALNEGLAQVAELRVKLMLDDAHPQFDPGRLPEVRLTRAALELAKSNLDRTAALYQRKVETAENYDRVRTEHELAIFRNDQAMHQARQLHQSYQTMLTRINTLRKALADATIVAPFDGWVVEKHVAVGERISSGGGGNNRLVTLIRTDPLRLSMTVPQQHISRIKEGQPVTFEVDAFPKKLFTGQVRYVAPAVADVGRSLIVEAVVPNSDRILKPGLFATAQLQLEEQTTELSVPVSAVQKHGDAGRVFVVRNGVVQEQVVALGQTTGDRVQITAGLASDDRIVARPERVREGVRIR
jgi:RND family efflux transporter MFP subunit